MIGRRALLAGWLALPVAARAEAPVGIPIGSTLRSVTLLVGAPAGSAIDQGARAFVPFLERHYPRTRVAVQTRPGEAGLVAWQALAEADPAARDLGWVATPSLPARIVDRPGCATLMQRLRLVGAVQKEPVCFVSHAGTPLGSVQDILDRAAEDAAALPLATPPAGSPPHLATLRLQKQTGMRLNIVAFPSAAAAVQAAEAGNVAVAALGLTEAAEGLRAGRLAGLGVAARTRHDAFPDLEALVESGLRFSATIWRGIAVPAGSDDARVAGLRAALREVADDSGFRDLGLESGFAATWLDGEAWVARAEAERAEFAALWRETPWRPAGVG